MPTGSLCSTGRPRANQRVGPGSPGRRAHPDRRYDEQAGISALLAAGFPPSGAAAGDDLEAVVGVQAIIVDFAHGTYQDAARHTQTVSQDMVSNLQPP